MATTDLRLNIRTLASYYTVEQWEGNVPSAPDEQLIEPGTVVDYVAHVPGGMVKVRYNGLEVIIHPHTTVELS